MFLLSQTPYRQGSLAPGKNFKINTRYLMVPIRSSKRLELWLISYNYEHSLLKKKVWEKAVIFFYLANNGWVEKGKSLIMFQLWIENLWRKIIKRWLWVWFSDLIPSMKMLYGKNMTRSSCSSDSFLWIREGKNPFLRWGYCYDHWLFLTKWVLASF